MQSGWIFVLERVRLKRRSSQYHTNCYPFFEYVIPELMRPFSQSRKVTPWRTSYDSLRPCVLRVFWWQINIYVSFYLAWKLSITFRWHCDVKAINAPCLFTDVCAPEITQHTRITSVVRKVQCVNRTAQISIVKRSLIDVFMLVWKLWRTWYLFLYNWIKNICACYTVDWSVFVPHHGNLP